MIMDIYGLDYGLHHGLGYGLYHGLVYGFGYGLKLLKGINYI
jgi:hypothetical protein